MKPFRIIPILLCSICILNHAFAQTPDIAINLGIIDYASSCYAYAEASGNTYLVGRTYMPLDFDPGPAVYEVGPPYPKVFVVKYDADFNILWSATLDGSPQIKPDAATITPDGGIEISGFTGFDIVINSTAGSSTLLMPVGDPIFFIRFDAEGALVTAVGIGGPSNASAPFVEALTIDEDGNTYLSGTYRGNVDFDPSATEYLLTGNPYQTYSFIAKYNSAGSFVWAKKFGSAANETFIQKHTSDGAGNMIIGGIFEGTVDFNPDDVAIYNLISNGASDAMIAKYNSNGQLVWAGRLDEPLSNATVYNLATDPAKNIYIYGYFDKNCDFDITAGVLKKKPHGSNYYTAKYNSTGNVKWIKTINGEGDFIINAMTVDDLGNVYTTGQFSGTFDFDPDAGTFFMTGPAIDDYHTDLFFQKLDKFGHFNYAFKLSPAFEELLGKGAGDFISITNDDKILLSARFDGTCDIDPTAGVYMLTDDGVDHNGFIARYTQPALKMAAPNEENNFNVYPSPASSAIWISCDNESIDQLIVYDLQGKIIESFNYEIEPELYALVLDVSKWNVGTYLISVITSSDRYNKIIEIVR